MHEAIVLYTKGDDGVVLGRLGGLEPWDGAGEMAESRGQGWPVGGWALLGAPSVQDPVFAAFGRQVISRAPNQKMGFLPGLPGWDAPLGAVDGKGLCSSHPSHSSIHPSINMETEKGTSDPSWSA